MKKTSYFTLLFASLAIAANAATYTENFTSFVAGPIAGNGGWTTSDPDPDVSFVTTLSMANGNSLGLGGAVAAATNDYTTLNHSYVETIGRVTATFDLAIIDSTDFPGLTARDAYAFSFNGAGGSLFKVILTPDTQTLSPAADLLAEWSMSYSVNNGSPITLSIGIVENNAYNFVIDINGTGLTSDAMITVNDGINPALVRNVTGFAVDPLTSLTNVSVDMDLFDPAAAGDGYVILDNISVVPEPSSSLLVAIAGLGLISRRRRA